MKVKIIKKDGTLEDYNFQKIKDAATKSAERVLIKLSDKDYKNIKKYVEEHLTNNENTSIDVMHIIVENALESINPRVAKSYRDYRNYKTTFVSILNKVYKKRSDLEYLGDVDNANRDSALVSTQRSIVYDTLNGELYKQFFLNTEERQAMKDGYIYIHDRGARLDTMNCCLFDMENLLKDGFEMGNVWYNNPNSLDTAFDVISDIILSAASQQYGGFTVTEIDKLLRPYAQKSYDKYFNEFFTIADNFYDEKDLSKKECKEIEAMADKYAIDKITREMEQGFQGWEYKFNTIASSRGDYPFTTISLGLGTDRLESLISKICLRVRAGGQGKKGFKKPVLFPKITFLYDENLHGEGKELEWLFDEAIQCSSKAMYPDYLSLTGEGYIPSMYKKYGRVVSLMGALAGHEHLYIKINDEQPIDISIKDFFNYCKTGKLENYRKCQLYLSKDRIYKEHNLNIDYKEENDTKFPKSAGVYAITYMPEDVTYIGSTSNINRRFVEHRCHINKYGCLDSGPSFGDYNIKNYKFEVLDLTEDYEAKEREYIINTPNVNCKGNSKGYYKRISNRAPTTFTRPNYKPNPKYEQDLIHLEDLDIKVYDKDNKWVKINHIFKNDKRNSPYMMTIHYKEHNKNYKLCCTEDHPLWVGNKFVRADQIKVGDYLYRSDYLPLEVTQVAYMFQPEDSYDIGTATGSFIGSDIIMHNCRASLSPWFERGGFEPADENDKPVFVGRFNLGAISLNLPMIGMKAKQENRDFYEVLNYYLEIIRKLHKKTFEYLSHKKASTNPLGYCQGGFLNGHKNPNEELGEDFLRPMTMSFGITALNELEQVYHQKSLVEDGSFALEVMQYINDYVNRIKKEDNILYAIYGTPAETLCGTQVEQFRDKYGIVKNISDKEYVSNSFHCGVWEDITPVQKQDLENRFWNLFNGGKIQYCRYPIMYNTEAIKTLVRRAMKLGFYEGVNLALSYCEECGHQELDMNVCPKCGSSLITKIDRMNGYLGYTRVHGKSRYNKAKMVEIQDRKSM